ncbi:MAG: peptidase domain-containing ABC transporter [Rhodospirillaceae bacterium]
MDDAEAVKALSPWPKTSPDLILGSLFLNVLSLALPLSLLQIYDRIVPNSSLETLALLVLGVLTALILEAVLRLTRSYATGWSSAKFEHSMGNSAFSRVLRSGVMDVQKEGSGVLLERMSALRGIKEFYGGQAATNLIDLPFVFVFLGAIWFLGGIIVVVPLVVLGVFAVLAIVIGRGLRTSVEAHSVANDRRLNFIIEVLQNIHTVKSMAMESLLMRRFERLQETAAQNNFDVAKRNAASLSTSTFFSQLTMVLVSSAGAYLVINQELTVGQLAACTLLAGRTLQPLQRFVGLWTRYQTIEIGRGRIKEIMDLPARETRNLPPMPDVQGRVTMRNVHFRYGDSGQDILRGVDLDVAAGECIGIKASNGSGKSTLLSVLAGVLPPSQGDVLYDSQSLSNYDPLTYKFQLGYLPQNGVLFKGTILENITMFDPDYYGEALEVADDLGLTEVVASLPLGFETVVGDGAYDTLPTGLRQRVAIARALVHTPRVILFDEANSAVDSAGDKYLRAALQRMKEDGHTMILVSHRPSLLRLTHRTFQLAMGTLVETQEETPVATSNVSPTKPLRQMV